MKTLRGCVLLGILSTLLWGCNPQDADNLKRDTGQLARTTGESLKNASVAAKVNGVLSVWKGVDMSGLHVEAKDGVVTLGGHVRTKQEKAIVENVVRQIRGVDKVISQLRVQP
jgi:hyperosmotically inducible periplasmic protein